MTAARECYALGCQDAATRIATFRHPGKPEVPYCARHATAAQENHGARVEVIIAGPIVIYGPVTQVAYVDPRRLEPAIRVLA